MKRIAALVFTVLFMVGTIALAEDGSLVQWTDEQYVQKEAEPVLCVLRPKITLYASKGKGRNDSLKAGEEVTVLSQEGEWCYISTNDGRTGFVKTRYIGYVIAKIRLNEVGVCLSPRPGMTSMDFGAASGGERQNENAFVLEEQGDFWYVVTDEGYSGWVNRYDENIVAYEEQE